MYVCIYIYILEKQPGPGLRIESAVLICHARRSDRAPPGEGLAPLKNTTTTTTTTTTTAATTTDTATATTTTTPTTDTTTTTKKKKKMNKKKRKEKVEGK